MTRLALILVALLAFAPLAHAQDDKKKESPFDVVPSWRGNQQIIEVENRLKAGKDAEALDLLDEILRRDIRNTDAHVYSALAWAHLGNFEKAKASLSNALAIEKGHMGAYVLSGMIALQERQPQQADYYLQALRIACQGEDCPEFQILKKALREAQPE